MPDNTDALSWAAANQASREAEIEAPGRAKKVSSQVKNRDPLRLSLVYFRGVPH